MSATLNGNIFTVPNILPTPWSSTLPLQSASSPVEKSEMSISLPIENATPFASFALPQSTASLNLDPTSSYAVHRSSIFPSPAVFISSEFIVSDPTTSWQEFSLSEADTTSSILPLSPTTPLIPSSPLSKDTIDLLTPSFLDISTSTLIADSSSNFLSRQTVIDSLWSSAFFNFQTDKQFSSSSYLTDSYLSSLNINTLTSNTLTNTSGLSGEYGPSVTEAFLASDSRVNDVSFNPVNVESTNIIISTFLPSPSEFSSPVSTLFESQVRNNALWPSSSSGIYNPTISVSLSSVLLSDVQSHQESRMPTIITNSNAECCSSTPEQNTEWILSDNTVSNTIDTTVATGLESSFSVYSTDSTFSTILEIPTDFLQTGKYLLIS